MAAITADLTQEEQNRLERFLFNWKERGLRDVELRQAVLTQNIIELEEKIERMKGHQ